MFEDFAERSERIVMAADRRTELDKAYQVLIDALFGTIERVAFDHPKTPHDVIKFGQSLLSVNSAMINNYVLNRKLQQDSRSVNSINFND